MKNKFQKISFYRASDFSTILTASNACKHLRKILDEARQK
jgi:hypothetical protein